MLSYMTTCVKGFIEKYKAAHAITPEAEDAAIMGRRCDPVGSIDMQV
jgi:hypothetical protein